MTKIHVTISIRENGYYVCSVETVDPSGLRVGMMQRFPAFDADAQSWITRQVEEIRATAPPAPTREHAHRHTPTHCHCGARREESDHCDECGCEEYEGYCGHVSRASARARFHPTGPAPDLSHVRYRLRDEGIDVP